MTTVISIIAAIIVFGLLVFTHELGHFLAAKACGIGVIEFSIGMGPTILSFTKGETKYSLKAIPFGGSCAMVGEDAAGAGEIDIEEFKEDISVNDDITEVISIPENSFKAKSVWARILTVAAGPLFNFIFALILGIVITALVGTNPARVYNISSGLGAEKAGLESGDIITEINDKHVSMGAELNLYLQTSDMLKGDVKLKVKRGDEIKQIVYDPSYSVYRTGISYYINEMPMRVLEVEDGSAAFESGIKPGDIITEINGLSIKGGEDFKNYFSEKYEDGASLDIRYTRDGKDHETKITPKLTEGRALGFSAFHYREDATFLSAIKGGWDELVYGIKAVFLSLRMMVTGQVGLDSISGPVGIVNVIGQTITESVSENGDEGVFYAFLNVINISILLAANLGIVNLFPFPALDGGRLLILIVEAITGKKLPAKAEGIINAVGFAILMLLMVVVLFSDVFKLIF